MANAKALFKRHSDIFFEVARVGSVDDAKVAAIIYAACIIAEAIRNEYDETEEVKYKEPTK